MNAASATRAAIAFQPRDARADFSFFHPVFSSFIAGTPPMSEPSPRQERARQERARIGMARVFARLAALLVSIVLGPLVAAVLVVLLLLAGVRPEEIGISPLAVSGPTLVGGVLLCAIPAALLCALASLPFITRERISLTGALIVATGSALATLVFVSERSPEIVLVSEAMPVTIILALVSAAVCWRATKRWHSP